MASGIIPRTGFARSLFSVEEAMIVNMNLPFLMFRAGDEESPDSHRALCLQTGRIYFFISFLSLPFGLKKRFPASRFVEFFTFPRRIKLYTT
jgi:hypothetical protein